ncbi:tetratricopeptide repeat protein [Intestinibacter bartlettii]|uniref:Tetratricopeptide repeat protein n=1 Tax=Intestinibacter bartlettii TaxID=261299 RepID=A0ABS6DZR3_9FIRM|nr:tetratricopeptide repeat protein [Intestinibacter bartlettii]
MTNAQEYINQGKILYDVGNYEESINKYEEALKEEPMNIDIYFGLSESYIMLEDFESARESLNNILLIDKDNAEAYFHIGNTQFLQDMQQEGKESYLKAISLGFSDIAIFINYAIVCEENGNYYEALKYYNKALTKDKFRADIRLRKIEILIGMNKIEESLENLDLFIQLNPDLFEGHHLKFLVLLENNRVQEAEKTLENAIKLFPEDEGFLFDKIILFQEQQKIDEALNIINTVFKDNNSKLILNEKVKIYLAQNKIEDAKFTLKQIISLDKDEFDEDSRFYLVMIYISEKNYLEAQKYIDEIIEYKSEGMYYYSALFLKGQVIKELDGQNKCKTYYEDIVSILRQGSLDYPDKMDLIIYRGLIYTELCNYEKALEMANYLLAISDNIGEAYLLRSQIYEAMGEVEKSQKDREIAIQKSATLSRFGI